MSAEAGRTVKVWVVEDHDVLFEREGDAIAHAAQLGEMYADGPPRVLRAELTLLE